jgi:hypothetical protein
MLGREFSQVWNEMTSTRHTCMEILIDSLNWCVRSHLVPSRSEFVPNLTIARTECTIPTAPSHALAGPSAFLRRAVTRGNGCAKRFAEADIRARGRERNERELKLAERLVQGLRRFLHMW